jgi:predicted PurR-regulated permease PerM
MKLSVLAIPFLTIMSAAAFCYFARPILVPLVTAATFAYVLSPSVEFFVRHKVPRVVSVAIVLSVTMGVFGGLGYILLVQTQELITAIPTFLDNLEALMGGLRLWLSNLPPQFQRLLPPPDVGFWQQVDLKDFSVLPKTLFSGLGSVLSFLVWGTLVGFLTLFMLLDQPKMYRRLLVAMGAENESMVKDTMAHINHQLRRFLQVKLVTSAGVGIVTTVGLLLLDVPYAYVWGPLAGFLNVIPYIGAIISAVPPIIIATVHAQSVWPGLWVLIFFVVLQNIEGNIITPKLVDNRVNLNVLAVLVATVVWGWLWGAVGVLLAVPITAAIKVVCERIEPLVPIAELLG